MQELGSQIKQCLGGNEAVAQGSCAYEIYNGAIETKSSPWRNAISLPINLSGNSALEITITTLSALMSTECQLKLYLRLSRFRLRILVCRGFCFQGQSARSAVLLYMRVNWPNDWHAPACRLLASKHRGGRAVALLCVIHPFQLSMHLFAHCSMSGSRNRALKRGHGKEAINLGLS